MLLRNLVLAISLLAVCTVSAPAFASAPWWGTPPDPFHTEGAIRKDTPELADPLGRDCAVPGGALTFSAAVSLALCRNPQTRSSWAIAHQQAAALGVAESAWLPTLSVTGAEAKKFTDDPGTVLSYPRKNGDATANLTWTLYDFGGRSGRIKSAHNLLDAAAFTASSSVQQTVSAVVQAYYGVVAGDALLGSTKITEDVTAHSLDIARSLSQGGVGTLADVLQAETAHGQAVLARVQADQSAKSARGTLSVTLGLTADEPFKLAAEPVPTEVPVLSARMADLMAEAARQRPDLKAAQAQRDAAEANITVARAAGRPSLSIGAVHSIATSTGQPNQNYDQVGISVTVPIFSGFNTSYGVRQAQAALRVQEANLEQVGLNVTLGVWNGYYLLESANEQLTATATLLKTSDDNLKVALGRYQAGVGSILDVLTAQTAAGIARQLRINAELGWKVARAQLALALGRLSSAEPLQDRAALP